MMEIFTAQYRYKGDDRVDITVKGNPEHVLAPTWKLVKNLQDGKITQWEYSLGYFSLIVLRACNTDPFHRDSLTSMRWDEDANLRKSITLVCFCPPDTFCHRILAARLLENMGLGVYRGERILT